MTFVSPLFIPARVENVRKPDYLTQLFSFVVSLLLILKKTTALRYLLKVIYWVILAGLQALHAQKIPDKGVPWIDNYTTEQYNNHGKIWDIASAGNGIVYMAGDAGLLEYDGQIWNQFKGSKGCTRSLLVVNDSLIYSGSDLDFGVWNKNEYDQWAYTSLYPFGKDPNEENEEFWDVYRMKDYAVFISFTNVYIYRNKQITKIPAPTRFAGSFQGKDKIYLADEKNGLYVFNGMTLKRLFNYPSEMPFKISGVFETPNGLIIAAKDGGLFLFNSEKVSSLTNAVSGYLKKDQVFCAAQINDAYYAFGTILNGLYITDLNGHIIQHINRKKGLLNNTILSVHYASNGLLWLGMDYGIAAIHLHSGFTYFIDYQGDYGSAKSALLSGDQFYLGTNQGLYHAQWQDLNNKVNSQPFALVKGSEGQVWALGEVNGTILCGHDKGLFAVSGNTLRRIYGEPGVWTFIPYKDKYLLTGNYNGVSVFKMEGGRYAFLKKLELILGSCNQLLNERDNILWVNIPNFGLIRFELDDDLCPQNRIIFPATSFTGHAPHLLKDEKGITLLTDTYRYRYDPGEKQFIQQSANRAPKNVAGLPDGIYMPAPLGPNFHFYPIYNGFALVNTSVTPPRKSHDLLLLVRKIEAFNNHTRQLLSRNASIPYSLNNLSIRYAVPNQNQVMYQYQLVDFSKQWSDWTTHTSVDFLNLAEGDYTLKIRAKVNGELSGGITDVAFRIAPPWYRTYFAYAAYVVLTILLYLLIRAWQNFRLREQKKILLEQEQNALHRQAEKYRQEALISQQQELEQELNFLKQQLKHKSVELAKQARENENKNRLLSHLKEKIEEVRHDPATSKLNWAEMKRLLELYLETDDKAFEIQIDDLHQEFFQKLREQFPDLSLYDLRLCAYLKIGLNSKEISEIQKVLPSSINVSRSRLRKKLNLQHDQDLYGYLNQLG
ncbi:MAG: hypothetical protein DYG98_00940 [Haliscomenobacteraceae bacterium CHB4]|nr:hypothetical protein [Haliscomenobacteraceae bacterium CHB4]